MPSIGEPFLKRTRKFYICECRVNCVKTHSMCECLMWPCVFECVVCACELNVRTATHSNTNSRTPINTQTHTHKHTQTHTNTHKYCTQHYKASKARSAKLIPILRLKKPGFYVKTFSTHIAHTVTVTHAGCLFAQHTLELLTLFETAFC